MVWVPPVCVTAPTPLKPGSAPTYSESCTAIDPPDNRKLPVPSPSATLRLACDIGASAALNQQPIPRNTHAHGAGVIHIQHARARKVVRPGGAGGETNDEIGIVDRVRPAKLVEDGHRAVVFADVFQSRGR